MADEEPRIIKRYANRKLYDTQLRQFTTLDDLSGLLDKGVRFVVRDHDSGDDRTDDILAQVLGKRVRGGSGSGDLLSGLLRAPTQIAEQLIGEKPADDDTKPKKKKKKDGAKAGKGKKSGKSDKAPKNAEPAAEPEGSAAQEQEIQELRSQVAELTQAVSMLVNDKLAQAEAADDEDGDEE